MSMNILNDISSVYLEQVVGEGITIQDFKKKRSASGKLLLLAEQESASPERAAHRLVDPDFEG
jgi:hypothetical protein